MIRHGVVSIAAAAAASTSALCAAAAAAAAAACREADVYFLGDHTDHLHPRRHSSNPTTFHNDCAITKSPAVAAHGSRTGKK